MSSIKKENLALTLAVSAILSTPACKPIMMQPQQFPTTPPNNQGTQQPISQQDQQSTAFFNSQYTYNDAALLADFWGKAKPWDAKLKIGSLLLNANNRAVQQALINAKRNQRPVVNQEQQQINAFGSKYTYKDAELLANYWRTATVWDAKLKIGNLMLQGDDARVQQDLNSIKNPHGVTQQEQQQINVYASKYTYKDAELLAKLWGTASVWDAKLKIGSLLMNGREAVIQQDLSRAKSTSISPQEQQQFNVYASKYTYNDATRLANFWGKASVWETKLKMGRLLMNGNDAAVQNALRNAP